MNFLHDIPTFIQEDIINVVVEIPKGTTAKYEISEDGRTVQLVRFLHNKYRYIYNYGSIPRTVAGDGDMMDAIVLCDEPILPGTVIQCKVVGMIKTIDANQQDDKVICIPKFSNKKVTKSTFKPIRKFLSKYKYPDQKSTQILETVSAEEAIQAIQNCSFIYVNKPSNIARAHTEFHNAHHEGKKNKFKLS